jgi:hypothetical protein
MTINPLIDSPVNLTRTSRSTARSTFRSSLLFLLITPLVILLNGCAADPSLVQNVFPLMPASFDEAPPPRIQVLLEAERERLLGRQADGSIDISVISSNITPPDVIFLTDTDVADLQSLLGVSVALTDDEVEAIEDADTESAAPAVMPQVTVRNRSVNIRSGPGTSFSVVAGATQGTTFEVLGQSEEPIWWRICCVRGPDDGPEEATLEAWISNVVVTVNELAEQQPVIGPLLPDDLEAEWDVLYACVSERCEVPICTATISASVRNASDNRWLEVERKVTWDDECGEDSTWQHQLDRVEASERYAATSDFFIFNFWAGANPGPFNSLYSLEPDVRVNTWCSDEQSTELEEGDGWSALYQGKTCHDIRTGMLVSMKYNKRWLYTGTFEGDVYERAYFGDFEVYEVRLSKSNVELDYVQLPTIAGDDEPATEVDE